MALIQHLEQKTPETKSVHRTVEASYFIVTDAEGNKYLQIETYGSADRKIKGKTSQAIQFDKESASQLFDILKQEFQLS